MTLVVSSRGEQILLDAATGKTPASAWTLRLFTNNHVPTDVDTEADYTQAAGGSYLAIAIDATQWVTSPGTPAVSQYPLQRFTFSGPLIGPASIYGYYVTRADGALVYAERLATAFTPANAGDHIDVALAMSLGRLTA